MKATGVMVPDPGPHCSRKWDAKLSPRREDPSLLPTVHRLSLKVIFVLLFPLGSGSVVKGMEQFQKLGVLSKASLGSHPSNTNMAGA